jgi:hypothetical protein
VLRLFAAALFCACDDAGTIIGTAGTGGSGGSGGTSPTQQGFQAQYILSSVFPTPFVPAAGITQKSVIGQCVDIRTNGTMVQSVLYTQDNPALIMRETDTWTYTLSGTNIVTSDPLAGAGATAQAIGTTSSSQISVTRVLRNGGAPVVRTLVFSKVSQLSTPCGS